MGRNLYLTKEKGTCKIESRVISLQEFADGENSNTNNCVVAIQDMTQNFEDLNYWDSGRDLNGKTSPTVMRALFDALQKMRNDGYVTREWSKEDEESCTIPVWKWGLSTKRRKDYPAALELLSDDERASVLMFHLNGLYDLSTQYDDSYTWIVVDPYADL